jgi:hypothetical protein
MYALCPRVRLGLATIGRFVQHSTEYLHRQFDAMSASNRAAAVAAGGGAAGNLTSPPRGTRTIGNGLLGTSYADQWWGPACDWQPAVLACMPVTDPTWASLSFEERDRVCYEPPDPMSCWGLLLIVQSLAEMPTCVPLLANAHVPTLLVRFLVLLSSRYQNVDLAALSSLEGALVSPDVELPLTSTITHSAENSLSDVSGGTLLSAMGRSSVQTTPTDSHTVSRLPLADAGLRSNLPPTGLAVTSIREHDVTDTSSSDDDDFGVLMQVKPTSSEVPVVSRARSASVSSPLSAVTTSSLTVSPTSTFAATANEGSAGSGRLHVLSHPRPSPPTLPYAAAAPGGKPFTAESTTLLKRLEQAAFIEWYCVCALRGLCSHTIIVQELVDSDTLYLLFRLLVHLPISSAYFSSSFLSLDRH